MNISHDQLKMMRRISRQRELDRRQTVGSPRSKSWGGKPNHRQERRNARRELDQY